MSYLDIPRIHFAGSFYFDPGTLNNRTMNYSNYNGQEPDLWFPDKGNTGWNPNGVMQAFFSNCKVTSVLDDQFQVHQDAAADPLIGARVDSQGPTGVIGYFEGAPTSSSKFSDYDSDQQYRTQVNGMWLGVLIPGPNPRDISQYAGFYGFLEPCNLRDLGLVLTSGSEIPAGGNYFSKIDIHAWVGDVSKSPLLSAFKELCQGEVAVRFTLDAFQGKKGTPNNDFGYGRVQGNFAPFGADELTQLAPRRVLPAFSNQPSGSGDAEQVVHAPKSPADEKGSYPQPLVETLSQASPANPWKWYQDNYGSYSMPAFAKVSQDQTHLTLDFGTILPQTRADDGTTLPVLRKFTLGYQDGANQFIPLSNGSIELTDSDFALFQSANKTISYFLQTGLFVIALEPGESEAIANRPLSLMVYDNEDKAHLMRQEDAEGNYIDIDPPAIRLEQGERQAVNILWSQFGVPVAGKDPITQLPLYAYDVTWAENDKMPPGDKQFEYIWSITPDGTNGVPSSISFTSSPTNQNGIAAVTIIASDAPMNLGGPRVGMLSRISFLLRVPKTADTLPPTGQWNQKPDQYSEPASGLEFFTALVWEKYEVPDTPTWDRDVKVLMPLLAKLYPGMASKLDIGDEETLKNNSAIFISFLSKSWNDPAFMPVTRELSASRMAMLRKWLQNPL